jgi:hypothetical protein
VFMKPISISLFSSRSRVWRSRLVAAHNEIISASGCSCVHRQHRESNPLCNSCGKPHDTLPSSTMVY